MEGSFVEYEQSNNVLLTTLRNDKELFRATIKNALECENAFLLVPMSISLEGIEITTSFLETHTIICPENPKYWISLNGLPGTFSDNRELIHIIGTPIVDKTILGPLFDITAYFRDNRNHFTTIFESFSTSSNTPTRPILREWKVVIGDILVPIVLIGEPITYEGCVWTKRSTNPPAEVLSASDSLGSKQVSSAASSNSTKHRRITSNSNAQINSMLTLLDLPSTVQEKPPLFPPQEDMTSPIPLHGGVLSGANSTCNSANTSPTNSPPGSPGRGSKVLSRNSSLTNVMRSTAAAMLPSTNTTNTSSSPTSTTPATSSSFSFASKIPFFPIKTPSLPAQLRSAIKQQPVSNERVVPEASQKSFFFQMMAKPEAKPLATRIKMFVEEFERKSGSPNTYEERIKQFLTEMEYYIYAHPLWKGASEQNIESTSEGLEKYVIAKLYPKLFMSDEECIKRDKFLSERIRRLSFVQPEHLDIKVRVRPESIATAATELNKLAHYKSPRDKLICIMNCCKVIYSQILNTGVAGADDFLPILIYIVLKANPPHICSNIKFISSYRNPSKLSISELGYYFTQLESGVSFIEQLDATRLSIDPAEYDRLFSSTEHNEPTTATMTPLSDNHRAYSDDSIDDAMPATRMPSSSALSLPLSSNSYNKFLNKTVNELTIGEVAELLDEYKAMAQELEMIKRHLLSERSK